MPSFFRPLFRAFATGAVLFAPIAGAQAAGDLLVAPTRVIFDGERGTEVILNNIGSEEATYRISLELRRMTPQGNLEDIDPENANATEQAALSMIRYAPRRVTLPPNQPQAIRIGIRPDAGLPDGEYRAHMLFRAIPKAKPATAEAGLGTGLSIELIPIYGITIPIIIRQGNLSATAAIANPRLEQTPEGPMLAFELSRQGDSSVYGEIRVTRPGGGEPLFMARGIAVYPELAGRTVALPVDPEVASAMRGEIKLAYYETPENGGGLIAETRTVLR